MTIRLHPSGEEYSTLLRCAVRYALHSGTYDLVAIISIIDQRMPYLQSATLYAIGRDICTQTRRSGADIMKKLGWIGLLDRMEAELERRKYP